MSPSSTTCHTALSADPHHPDGQSTPDHTPPGESNPGPAWTRIGPATDFPPQSVSPACVEGRRLLIAHLAAGFRAWLDACPHAGLSLHDGSFHGNKLTCRHHGFAFDLRDGRNIDDPWQEQPLMGFPIEQRGTNLWVQLPATRK